MTYRLVPAPGEFYAMAEVQGFASIDADLDYLMDADSYTYDASCIGSLRSAVLVVPAGDEKRVEAA
jgi:hypothetical protein